MNITLSYLFKKLIKCFPQYAQNMKKLLDEFHLKTLVDSINNSIINIPFYHNPHYPKSTIDNFNITTYPILRKSDIMGHEEEFVSKKCIIPLMHKVKTGGSTGQSLQLYYSISTLIKKDIVSDYAFSLIGKKLNIAILRGNKPKNGEISEVVNKKTLILSSYLISDDTLDTYLSLLNSHRIECIHAYPSSLSILARLIKRRYHTANIPTLKGILTSSEIFSKEDKMLVKEVFPNVKVIDYYSHNELACCALSIDGGHYTFFPNYGYVEFIETGETLDNGNKIAEIIATSIMNSDMPFIRYGTDDYVELDSNNNVVSIIGRTSDFIINSDGNLIPCIISTRPETLENVNKFQYLQDEIGVLHFRIVVNNKFSPNDITFIQEDLSNSFSGKIKSVIDIVDDIERTKRGKQPRLIQKLNIR